MLWWLCGCEWSGTVVGCTLAFGMFKMRVGAQVCSCWTGVGASEVFFEGNSPAAQGRRCFYRDSASTELRLRLRLPQQHHGASGAATTTRGEGDQDGSSSRGRRRTTAKRRRRPRRQKKVSKLSRNNEREKKTAKEERHLSGVCATARRTTKKQTKEGGGERKKTEEGEARVDVHRISEREKEKTWHSKGRREEGE